MVKLSAEPNNITGFNHTLKQLITQLALSATKKSQGKYPKPKILIVYTNYLYRTTQNTNYWYRTTLKHSVICTGIVGLASPSAKTT